MEQENVSRLYTFIKDVSPTSLEFSFFRPAWVKVNCLQTGLVYSALKCTNRVWLLCWLVSVVQRNRQLSML